MLLSASSSEAYALLGGSSNLSQVYLSVASASVAENNADPNELTFTRNGMTGSLLVKFTVTGTATRGTDYVIKDASGKIVTGNSITINDGKDQEKLYIVNINDNIGEGDEYLKVALASSKSYTVVTDSSSATVTITDDEPVVSVTAAGGSGFGFGGELKISDTLSYDLNGDGLDDIINPYEVIDGNDMTSGIQILLANKSAPGSFAQPIYYSVGNGMIGKLALADVNGDKKLDMVAECLTGQSMVDADLLVFINTGKGTFNDPAIYSFHTMMISDLTIVDINGDGKNDLVMQGVGYYADTQNVMASGIVMLNTGKGAFGTPTTTLGIKTTDSDHYMDQEGFSVTDINGDKKLDLVFITQEEGGPAVVTTLLGKGKLGFDAPVTQQLLAANAEIDQGKIADINGDGKADLLLVEKSAGSEADTFDYTAHIFLNNGKGVFTEADATVALLTGVGSNYELAHLSLQDLDNDKDAELVFVPILTSTNSGQDIKVYKNTGNGTFAAPTAVEYTGDGQHIDFSDVNGDGYQDIIMSGLYDTTGQGNYITRVDVLTNWGDGTFRDSVAYSATQMGSKINSIAIGDVNGDGKDDLILDSIGEEHTRVMINNGDGTFSQETGVIENGDALTFTIKRTGDTTSALSVGYSLTGTATINKDYTLKYGDGTAVDKSVIVIPAGESSVTITLNPADSANAVEAMKTIRLLLKNGIGYQVSAAQHGMLVALEDSAPFLSVVADDKVATETISGQTADNGSFIITRSGSTAADLTATFTIGGSAKRGVDYVLAIGNDTITSNTFTIAAGQSSVTIKVIPIADDLGEKDKTVTLTLGTSKQNWNVSSVQASATVTVKDLAVSIITAKATTSTTSEQTPDKSAVVTFTRTGGDISQALTMTYTVSGTATSGLDYQALSGTVTFAAGKTTATVTISAIDDLVTEGDETVILTVAPSNTGEYKVAAKNNAATVTVKDYEVAPDSPSGSILNVSYKATEIASGKTVSDSVTIYMGSGKCFLVDRDDITGGTYVYTKTSNTTATLTTTQVDGEVHELNLTFTSATKAKITSANIYDGQIKTGTMTGSCTYSTPKSTYLPADLIGLEFQGKLLGNSEKLHTNQIATLTFDAANVTVQDWDGTESIGYTYAAVAPTFGFLTYADGSKFLVQFSSNTKAQYWEYDTGEVADYWEFGTITIKQPSKML